MDITMNIGRILCFNPELFFRANTAWTIRSKNYISLKFVFCLGPMISGPILLSSEINEVKLA